jgi:hypothetical protein
MSNSLCGGDTEDFELVAYGESAMPAYRPWMLLKEKCPVPTINVVIWTYYFRVWMFRRARVLECLDFNQFLIDCPRCCAYVG